MPVLCPEVESADPLEIQRIQLERLRWTLSRAKRSPLYKGKLGRTRRDREVKDVGDIRKLPLTTKAELRESYPFGAVAVGAEELALFSHSSGTSGKPIGIYHSPADLEHIVEIQSRQYCGAGIGRGDRVQLMLSPVAGYVFTRSLHRVGAMTIFSGPGNAMGQIALIRDLGVSAVLGLPSFLMHLAERDLGIRDASVRTIVAMGEPLAGGLRRSLEDSWGAEVYAQYGSTELGAGFIECEEHAGLHIHWDSFIVETLDPETQEPTDGEGELVFTTLRREATPLIRYRTGDLVRIVREECGCGRTNPRLFPEGRIDEMLKVKGTAVYPSVLREQLAEIREVTGFQVVVGKEGYLDTLELRIQTGTPGEDLRSSVKDVVKAATGITPKVVFLPEGSLTPASGKARQFVDLRDGRG